MPTGLFDYSYNINSSVYPNPMVTEAVITIEPVILNEVKNLTLKLYDMLGRKQGVSYSINNNQLRIKRGNLPSGIYFFTIANGKQTHTGKVAVQ